MNRSTDQRAKMMRGLHAEASKRGLSHDGLHELVEKRYGVASLSQLSEAQLREWYREFSGKGFRHPGMGSASRRRAAGTAGKKAGSMPAPRVVELAGADDIAMLIDLAARIGWSVTALHKFVARQLGREQIRTMADVNKVLWALKAIARRRGIKV